MKYSYFFIYFLMAAVSCNAMEPSYAPLSHKASEGFRKAEFILSSVEGEDRQGNKFHCMEEITAIKNPRHVRYLTKDRVVISGAISGGGQWAIVDLKTKKAQKIHSVGEVPNLQISTNKKIIIYDHFSVKIYNVSDVQEGFMDTMYSLYSVASHPYHDVIFGCCGHVADAIVKYNCVTNSREDIPINHDGCHRIAMHPKNKEIICMASYSGSIFICDINNEIVLRPETKNFILPVNYCPFCSYSSDGSYIVAGNHYKLFIIDPSCIIDPSDYLCLEPEENEFFKNIAFHPHKSVLATLCEQFRCCSGQAGKQIVRYWNIKTQQLIDTSLEFDAETGYNLDFSENGYELIIALENKCVRVLVPFTVKEKCVYLWWVLKELITQEQEIKEILPRDILWYWGNILLETFKF